MKRIAFYLGLVVATVASCSVQEKDFQRSQQDDVVFYASFEQPSEGTRVYANEDLLLRWTADDRVSIFNKLTYNQQYKFTGETGDNAGGFRKIDTDEFVTGNIISHVVSVYPYQEGTKITEDEVLTVTLPSEQHYAENTFGLGDNTMVSVSEDNILQYKNVGGYLMLKLYGQGISVSSITLRGNNGEKLAGKAAIMMPLEGVPAATMVDDATKEITLTCETPVQLGASAEECTQFWFVVPPVTFSKGFTITVSGNGGFFEKTTDNTLTIDRNNLSKMSPIEVEIINNIVFADENLKAKLVAAFDTNSDGELSSSEAAAVGSVESLQAAFGSDKNYRSFDEFQFFTGINCVADSMFKDWTLMKSIVLPETIISIGDDAFRNCSQLASLHIPDSVTTIGSYAFGDCYKLSSINIPDGVKTISDGLFLHCSLLSSLNIPEGVTAIGSIAFAGCSGLKTIIIPSGVTIIDFMAFSESGLTSVAIPGSVKLINDSAFSYCRELITVMIHEGVTTIGNDAFKNCTKLESISLPRTITNCTGPIFSGCTSVSHLYVASIEDWFNYLSVSSLYGDSSPLENTLQSVHFYVAEKEVFSMILPDDSVKIPRAAFMNCAYLTTVSIPETVSNIGNNAFYKCFGLESITVFAESVPKGGYNMFAFTNNCPISVPAESVEAYKVSQYWSVYSDRIQALAPIPESVDLGLPSGLKWASFNLGASKPEEFGDYYAWGEIEPYYSSLDPLIWKEGKESGYDWPSYRLCMGTRNTLTKYCFESDYGYNGFTDGKTVLNLVDDVAHANLGGNWRMPTDAEWTELRENCTWTWTSINGIYGRKGTSKINANSIFLPAAGICEEPIPNDTDSAGFYWSSTLCVISNSAWMVHFHSQGLIRLGYNRCMGFSIRPVYAE